MRIISSSHEILNKPTYQELLLPIEVAARTCYKSEPGHASDPEAFVGRLIKLGHESVIEHKSLSIRFICDRGVSHELVRHRLCSFSQESTRYCNYSKDKFGNECTFILPSCINAEELSLNGELFKKRWLEAMQDAEDHYFYLLSAGGTPQEARSVLPNSLKTEIVVTTNLREWRLILNQRTSPQAHPDMRELMLPLLEELKESYPVFFGDI